MLGSRACNLIALAARHAGQTGFLVWAMFLPPMRCNLYYFHFAICSWSTFARVFHFQIHKSPFSPALPSGGGRVLKLTFIIFIIVNNDRFRVCMFIVWAARHAGQTWALVGASTKDVASPNELHLVLFSLWNLFPTHPCSRIGGVWFLDFSTDASPIIQIEISNQ